MCLHCLVSCVWKLSFEFLFIITQKFHRIFNFRQQMNGIDEKHHHATRKRDASYRFMLIDMAHFFCMPLRRPNNATIQIMKVCWWHDKNATHTKTTVFFSIFRTFNDPIIERPSYFFPGRRLQRISSGRCTSVYSSVMHYVSLSQH